MFTNHETLEQIDSERHKGLRFAPAPDFRFAADLASAPLGASEVLEAAKHYVIVFSTDGPLLPLALLSLKEGANAFVDPAGKWLAPYVPAHVRRYPFILGNTDDAATFAIMFDREAPHFTGEGGELLYGEDGARGPALEAALALLKVFQQEVTATEKLLEPVTQVLTMQRLDITVADGIKASIDGLRAVDRDKMAALDDATLAGWVRGGLMALIDAHLASLGNMKALAERQRVGTESKSFHRTPPLADFPTPTIFAAHFTPNVV